MTKRKLNKLKNLFDPLRTNAKTIHLIVNANSQVIDYENDTKRLRKLIKKHYKYMYINYELLHHFFAKKPASPHHYGSRTYYYHGKYHELPERPF